MKNQKPKLSVKQTSKSGSGSLSFSTLVLVGATAVVMTLGYFSTPWLDRVIPPLPARQSLGVGGPAPAGTVQAPPPARGPVACTMEAKLCPDGSYVGRVLPGCQFAPCPAAPPAPSARQYRDVEDSFSLTLPASWDGYQSSKAKYASHDTTCLYFEGEGRQRFCIMQILAFTPEQWSSVSVKGQQALATRVINAAGTVIALDYSPGCAQLDEFQCARSQEVPGIFSTIEAW